MTKTKARKKKTAPVRRERVPAGGFNGARLRQYRADNGLGMFEMGVKIDAPLTWINELEKRDPSVANPNFDTLMRLCDATGLCIYDFVTGAVLRKHLPALRALVERLEK